MISFIIKKITGDRDSTLPNERLRIGEISGTLGILLNFTLFLVKGGLGILTNSISVIADAFNNLSDTASSLITIIGFKLSTKEADKEHPYGHGRIEYLTGLVISVLVIVVGYQFVISSVKKILHPTPINITTPTLIILILSISVKVFIHLLFKGLGKKINSGALLASSQDAKSDVLTTSVVIFGLILSRFTPLPLDGFIGVLIALYIIYSGIKLTLDTMNPLLGEKPDKELADKIKRTVLSYENIYDVHDLQIHNYGPSKTMATIDVEVPYDLSLVTGHNLIDRIERDVRKSLGISLVIHMDPINNSDRKFLEAKSYVNRIALREEYVLSVHDFRYTGQAEDELIIFEIVVDSKKTTVEERLTIKNNIEENLRTRFSSAQILIDVDLDVTIL